MNVWKNTKKPRVLHDTGVKQGQNRLKGNKINALKKIRNCETKQLNLWFKVGIDLFVYAGIKLHIGFGYYSHFPEMALLGNANAKRPISQKNYYLFGMKYQVW